VAPHTQEQPAEQLLRHTATLRCIQAFLLLMQLPPYRRREKATKQAYFTSSDQAVTSVITVFGDQSSSVNAAANSRLRKALKAANILHADPILQISFAGVDVGQGQMD
jgi:hypothetical protein